MFAPSSGSDGTSAFFRSHRKTSTVSGEESDIFVSSRCSPVFFILSADGSTLDTAMTAGGRQSVSSGSYDGRKHGGKSFADSRSESGRNAANAGRKASTQRIIRPHAEPKKPFAERVHKITLVAVTDAANSPSKHKKAAPCESCGFCMSI